MIAVQLIKPFTGIKTYTSHCLQLNDNSLTGIRGTKQYIAANTVQIWDTRTPFGHKTSPTKSSWTNFQINIVSSNYIIEKTERFTQENRTSSFPKGLVKSN